MKKTRSKKSREIVLLRYGFFKFLLLDRKVMNDLALPFIARSRYSPFRLYSARTRSNVESIYRILKKLKIKIEKKFVFQVRCLHGAENNFICFTVIFL
jgi:hypothetical protein